MTGLEVRARRAGARAVVRMRGRVAAALRERLDPVRGAAVRDTADGVVIEGPGIGRRWLSDPALRWITGMLR